MRLGLRILSVVCLLALSGCGPSKGQVAALLLPIEQQACDTRSLTVAAPLQNGLGVEMLGAGPYSPEKAAEMYRVNAWLQKHIQNPQLMQPANDGTGQYLYNDDGTARRVAFISSSGPVATVGASLCYFVPASINVEDIKVSQSDAKMATVVFTVIKRPTAFGAVALSYFQQIAADVQVSGGQGLINPMGPGQRLGGPGITHVDVGQDTFEHQATLQRLDATGWRVVSVDGSDPSQGVAIPLPTGLAPYKFTERSDTVPSAAPSASSAYDDLIKKIHDETVNQNVLSQVQPDGHTAYARTTTSLIESSHCVLKIHEDSSSFTDEKFVLENEFLIADLLLDNANIGAGAISLTCRDKMPCISQDYSDARRHASPMTHWGLSVPLPAAEEVVSDLRKLQNLCAAGGK